MCLRRRRESPLIKQNKIAKHQAIKTQDIVDIVVMTSKDLNSVRIVIKLIVEATVEKVVVMIAQRRLIIILIGKCPCQFPKKLKFPFVFNNNNHSNNQKEHQYISQRQSP